MNFPPFHDEMLILNIYDIPTLYEYENCIFGGMESYTTLGLHAFQIMATTPSIPLKPSQILPTKIGNQLDWDNFSGTKGVQFTAQYNIDS